MFFIILEFHLLLVLFVKRDAPRSCDLIVLIEKSSFKESGVAHCSASHLYVEASIQGLLNEGTLAFKAKLVCLNED